jgi:predicted CopG family antitoxin
MPTIRIDDDVYSWLKSQAVPFEDTPNSVLRRLAGLDKKDNTDIERTQTDETEKVEKEDKMTTKIKSRRIDGKYLNELWGVHAAHALYHQGGTFYENLHEFPGALFDPNGYVLFNTEREYNSCRYLNIGEKLNVPQGISSISGYRRMK